MPPSAHAARGGYPPPLSPPYPLPLPAAIAGCSLSEFNGWSKRAKKAGESGDNENDKLGSKK